MNWLEGPAVNLSGVLESRDRRQELIQKNKAFTLVCITIVMPGPVKLNKLSKLLFEKAKDNLKDLAIVEQSLDINGPWVLLKSPNTAIDEKKRCMSLEDSLSYGRLLDLDVYDNGESLSRPEERGCIVCHSRTKACARSRSHSLDELRQAVLLLSAELRDGT